MYGPTKDGTDAWFDAIRDALAGTTRRSMTEVEKAQIAAADEDEEVNFAALLCSPWLFCGCV